MRSSLAALILLSTPLVASAQESLKVRAEKHDPPAALAPEIQRGLDAQSFLIRDEQGGDFARIWLRRGIPGSQKPAGPQGAIQFPFLADGEFLGAVEFLKEGHDYREQPIAKGIYTMRYGLQPVNGDHLGVSTYRDYVLLLPAAKDKAPAPPARKELEERSAEAAQTSHPASFLLLMAPSGSGPQPAMHHDAEKQTWGVILPLHLQVKGDGQPMAYPVQLIVVGAAAA